MVERLALFSPIWLPLLIAVGFLLSPLRKRAQQNPAVRRRAVISIGAVAFVLSFVLATIVLTVILAGVAQYYLAATFTQQEIWAAQTEFVLREFIPDSIRPSCLTTESACATAETLLETAHTTEGPGERVSQASSLTMSLVVAVVATFISGAVVWSFTRSKNAVQPVTPPVVAG